MTNREKYLDEILSAMSWGKFSGEIDHCQNHKCDDCDFETGQRSCRKEATAWLQAEVDKEPEVDWNRVPVDTPIYVRDNEGMDWRPRYFARFADGLVEVWSCGTTSWSGDGCTSRWKYAKLAREDEQ